MRILHINNIDLLGKRFNGYELIEAMRSLGYEVEQCVWIKQSRSPSVWQVPGARSRIGRFFHGKMLGVERRLSIQSLLYVFPFLLLLCRRFYRADVIHLHLIHNHFWNLLFLPLLTKIKKTIWTIHDPWAFTGHCVHPFDCDRWRVGCGKCPYLHSYMPLRRDHTSFMWKVKRLTYRLSRFQVIVSSHWMKSRLEESPLFEGKKIHLIPFGVNGDRYKQNDRELLRRRYLIGEDKVVILIRSEGGEYKGLEHALAMLRRFKEQGLYKKRLVLLAVGDLDNLEEFEDWFHVMDLGWQNKMAELYNVADIFLMPSNAESFGLMAVEAMACGLPVVTFGNTAVEDTVGDGGFVAKYQDVNDLGVAVRKLIDDPILRKQLGARARERAVEMYDEKKYLRRLAEVYQG